MNIHNKGFADIAVVLIAALVVAGVAGYFMFFIQPAEVSQTLPLKVVSNKTTPLPQEQQSGSIEKVQQQSGGVSPTSQQGSVPSSAGKTTETPAPAGYPVVDTAQSACYSAISQITCSGTQFAGQDSQYRGNKPAYVPSDDGKTVKDMVTGLIWMRGPNTTLASPTAADKKTRSQAQAYINAINAAKYGGYADWRLPTIKELYSLIQYDGADPGIGSCAGIKCAFTPFIDTRYFNFAYGDENAGERLIDSQYLSATTFVGNATKYFGVNFADGRIKGYDNLMMGGATKTFFVQPVRGNSAYGKNSLKDNGDQTITDSATGLVWAKADSGKGMNWQEALAWANAQNASSYLGYSDWRLPNAKELQSIVDYSRSPETSNSAAISPLFFSTQIKNEAGQTDYPFYWTSTTHAASVGAGGYAVYVCFGRCLGYMNGSWTDIHGAGAQRSDPKTGDPSLYPTGHGPQGDAVRIKNYVRLVRGGGVSYAPDGTASQKRPSVSVSGSAGALPQQGVQQESVQSLQQPQPPAGGAPPQPAIDACSGKSSEAACSFVSPMGVVSGVCRSISGQIACVP